MAPSRWPIKLLSFVVSDSKVCEQSNASRVCMGIEELKKQEARRVRNEAERCLLHASIVLTKTAHEIDGYIDRLKTARIPLRRQAIHG